MTVRENAQSPLQRIVVGALILCAVFLAVAGILDGEFAAVVWVAVVTPMLFDLRNTLYGKPSAIRPDSPRWPVRKLAYVLALGIAGVALLLSDERVFARLSGMLLIITTLGYVAAFYYARKPSPRPL